MPLPSWSLLGPFLLCVAIAIKLDSPGPVFFRQRRSGFNHRSCLMWKFRSMAADAEAPGRPYRQATRNHPRVTRVGALLRRTSIDELPQLINDHRPLRHAVLPGITGWAQVNGYRGETDSDEKMAARIAHDLHYLRNWSPALDFWILVLTVVRGFVHKNAYWRCPMMPRWCNDVHRSSLSLLAHRSFLILANPRTATARHLDRRGDRLNPWNLRQ